MVNAMTTQPKPRFFTLHFPALRAINARLCVLFISGLFISSLPMSAGAFTFAAQPVYHPEPAAPLPEDTVAVSKLVQMLTSPIDAQRDRAFHQIRALAQHSPKIDLSTAVPALVSTYANDHNEKYRLAAVVTLYVIGDETGMQQVRRRFVQEPSLIVQYVSVCTLIDHYGPKAFGRDPETVTLARNVLARKHEAGRLAERRHLQLSRTTEEH